MEPDRAIEIVQKLADGVDPFTDESFPSSSPYQQADAKRKEKGSACDVCRLILPSAKRYVRT